MRGLGAGGAQDRGSQPNHRSPGGLLEEAFKLRPRDGWVGAGG